MNKHWLTTAIGIIAVFFMIKNAWSYPEYVAPTEADGCTSCHNDNHGNDFKPGILAAFEDSGLAGLKDFLHPATPVITDTKPVLKTINSKWDVTVGEAPLVIPLKVFDAEQDNFDLHGSAPTGYTLSDIYIDGTSNLPTINLIWAPTASQANKRYLLSVYAKETGIGRTLSSNVIKTVIQVWPARVSATRNVSQFSLQGAQWKNGKLNLAGQLLFDDNLTEAQRNTALASLTMSIKTTDGQTLNAPVKLTPQANGNWTKSLVLTGIDDIPCAIKLEYEGIKVSRTVNIASEEGECDD